LHHPRRRTNAHELALTDHAVTQSGLSERVGRFVVEHVDSAEFLEILLHLHRHAEQRFTAEQLSPIVYTVPAAALVRLEQLVARGFAASDGAGNPSYGYAPATPLLARQVDELAAMYAENRVEVIQLIFEKPRSSAQTMADAFRIR
jgi:hypothetical protein